MLSIYAKLSTRYPKVRAAVNMQGTVFTFTRLKIVPTIKNLICRCLIYDCGEFLDKFLLYITRYMNFMSIRLSRLPQGREIYWLDN